jgi:serine/threonine-protein kinase HipA
MRRANIYVNGRHAGVLTELERETSYQFEYDKDYAGDPVSLTMPLTQRVYHFNRFPPFFEGLLPEGAMLESLLRLHKLDPHDYFGQLTVVGQDMVGAVTVKEQE